MAAQGFFDRVGGVWTRIVAATVGTANAIPAMDATGRLDISMMPVGVTAEVTTCPAFEALSAGNFVNLFLSGGVIQARLANATDNTKPADGFVLANVLITATATVYRLGTKNTQLSGLTIGSRYYLDKASPGGVITQGSAPASSGNFQQELGIAESTTAMDFTGSKESGVTM